MHAKGGVFEDKNMSWSEQARFTLEGSIDLEVEREQTSIKSNERGSQC